MKTVEPVLIIHGVNTRSESSFERTVNELGDFLSEQCRLIPVFWGDLGVNITDISKILPTVEERRKSKLQWAIGGAWHATVGYATASARITGKIIKGLKQRAEGRHQEAAKTFEEIDSLAERTADHGYGYWWEFFDFFRGNLTQRTIPFLGDVLYYQTDLGQNRIQNRVLDIISKSRDENGDKIGTRAKPITIIAHSLGGVICFDLAVQKRPKIWIKKLITMGSQPSLFCLIYPEKYSHLRAGSSEEFSIPKSIGEWINLVNPFDPLAFCAANVFRMHDGNSPRDILLKDSISPTAHSEYWLAREQILKALEGETIG